ncbi:MAG: Flp pilus assembly complex ATPase component TadA [Actinomycetia bacterium]|nr:Flp pilus assembly complex ATPase component TadA [Actinomycetes bacterium]
MNLNLVDRDIEKRIRQRLYEKIQGKEFLQFPIADRQEVLEKIIRDIADGENILLSGDELQAITLKFDEDGFDLGPISILMKDLSVTEIMINDFDEIYIEKDGRLLKQKIEFKDSRHIKNIVDKILGPLGLRVDESHPMTDARLEDGSRINVVLNPISTNDIVVTIRKFKDDMKNMGQLIEAGSLSYKIGQFLIACVRKKLNLLVSGGTGTGKTTLLNVLSEFLPESERIITIEETLELRFAHQNLIRLEARTGNIEGMGEISIRDLVRNSLRMRPDRIIVGEIRGSEAVDVLQAMNTGHSGSMTTIHANSPGDAITRLETMILLSGYNIDPLTAERIIATSLNMIVHLRKTDNGKRIIDRISEVIYRQSTAGKDGPILCIKDIAASGQSGSGENGGGASAMFTGYRPSSPGIEDFSI